MPDVCHKFMRISLHHTTMWDKMATAQKVRGGSLFEIGYTATQRARRHLDAARKKLSRDNFCCSIAAQLPSPVGAVLKEKKKRPLLSSLVWRSNWGGVVRDNLGEGNCESKIAAREWGVNFCREALRCLAGPSGKGVMQQHAS